MSIDSAQTSQQQFVDLEGGSEWRFELEADENIAIRVQSPDPVYINSAELPPATWYPLFRYLKSSLYAPTPAKIEVSTLPSSQYSSTSTTQSSLIALHLGLEKRRILAKRHIATHPNSSNDTASRGPRIMVLGPASSGKTTVVKNLVNMALGSGMGWNVGVVGLDPSSPSNLIPGALSVSTPTHPIPTHHLAHPLGSPPASIASNTLSGGVGTVAWWYGHLEPTTKSADLWMRIVEGMAKRWQERCEKDSNALASGLIVDTSTAFTNAMLGTKKDDPKARYNLINKAIREFKIDTILVIGHEKLSIDLTRHFPTVDIIRIPKSGGTVDTDDHFREISHAWSVRSYFYGEPSLPKEIDGLMGRMVSMEMGLSPYSFQIGWETLTILRVGEENAAPSSALPLGSSRILSTTRLTRVDPGGPAHVVRLLNTVLAVVATTPADRIPKNKPILASPAKAESAEVVKAEEGKVKGEEGKDEVAKAEDGDGAKKESGEEGGVEIEAAAEEDVEQVVEDDDDEDEVPWKEEIGWREVLGFIVITAIDVHKKKYTILSPSPGKLPSTVAIAGGIEWVDSA